MRWHRPRPFKAWWDRGRKQYVLECRRCHTQELKGGNGWRIPAEVDRAARIHAKWWHPLQPKIIVKEGTDE